MAENVSQTGGHPPGIGRLRFQRRQQVERLSHSLGGHRKSASFGGKGSTEQFPNVSFYRELGSHRKVEVARDRPRRGTRRQETRPCGVSGVGANPSQPVRTSRRNGQAVVDHGRFALRHVARLPAWAPAHAADEEARSRRCADVERSLEPELWQPWTTRSGLDWTCAFQGAPSLGS